MSTRWSKGTRDRWFLGFLALSAVGVAVLFWPFAYVLLFASTTVVVTWPLYERVLARCRGRRALASGITIGLLALLVFGPLGLLMWLFIQEATVVVELIGDWLADGRLQAEFETWRDWYLPSIVQTYAAWLPEDFDLVSAVFEPLQAGLLAVLNTFGGSLPGLLNRLVSTGLDAAIFLFTVFTLYMEGPRVLAVANNLIPIEDAYLENLFGVFREFANNLVAGSLATAALQGIVAGIGYALVGVDRVVFLGICTAVFSFVPLVGTLVVWGPVCVWVGATFGVSWAIVLAVWNLALTGSVDNVVRPLFLRGSTHIHPLLIFLAVFGGLYWMSVPGALVGPVVVAFFLALYTIYCEDWLGQEPAPRRDEPPAFLERILGWFEATNTEVAPAGTNDEPPAE